MDSDVIFVMNSVFPNMKTYASRKKKKYIQAEDTSLSPFPIPETQERTKIAVTKTAANSQVTADWGMPNAASSPAPICIRPTPMELEVAPMRQKITTAVTNVFSHPIFFPVALSTMELKDRFFLRL